MAHAHSKPVEPLAAVEVPAAQIFHASEETVIEVMKRINKQHRGLTCLKRHLDSAALKRLSANGQMPQAVYVMDDQYPDLEAHKLIPYNKDYQAYWGDAEIWGNVVFCYGKSSTKSYKSVPEGLRATADSITF